MTHILEKSTLMMLVVVLGCAALNQPPPTRITAHRLQCELYPNLVDGNLATTSILDVKGSIEKDYVYAGTHAQRYQGSVRGTNKTQALIQLDAPTYVAYIEVYPVSNIPSLTVDTTAAQVESGAEIVNAPAKQGFIPYHFTPISDNRHLKSENAAVIRVNIEREVLFLRLIVSSGRDRANSTREPLTDKIKVPFKDIVIREVKFYGR